MPAISIIVPVFNVEKHLSQCINSILAQTYHDFELILVDDGSPDRCGEICDEYAKNDNRIVVIHKPNGGVSAARNAGIEQATCEWIMFVDSDDYIEHDTLEVMFKTIGNDNVELVIFGLVNDFLDKQIQERLFYEHLDSSNYAKIIECTDRYGLLKGPVCKFFRRSIIFKYNIRFDAALSYGEDTKFSFEYLSYCNELSFVPKYFYHYCFRSGDSLTKKKYPYMYWLKSAKMLRSFRLPILHRFEMTISYQNYIRRIYFDHFCKALNSLYDIETKIVRKERLKILSIIRNDIIIKRYIPEVFFHKCYKLIIKLPSQISDIVFILLSYYLNHRHK